MGVINIKIYKREEFGKWLKKNHRKESKVAVVLYKRHTGKPAPSHRELMEEAICFGWIDTTIKKLDEDRFIRYFSKRNKNGGTWSNNTVGYAKKLIEEGRMSEYGMEIFKLGSAKPTHDHGIPANPSMPEDLKLALSKKPKAMQSFEKYSPSAKRTLYRWILRAKLTPTRLKRIKYIVDNSIKGVKLF
jgi:uncharacterized protein YdeI (YjbR/CyaY-like superfamily)